MASNPNDRKGARRRQLVKNFAFFFFLLLLVYWLASGFLSLLLLQKNERKISLSSRWCKNWVYLASLKSSSFAFLLLTHKKSLRFHEVREIFFFSFLWKVFFSISRDDCLLISTFFSPLFDILPFNSHTTLLLSRSIVQPFDGWSYTILLLHIPWLICFSFLSAAVTDFNLSFFAATLFGKLLPSTVTASEEGGGDSIVGWA